MSQQETADPSNVQGAVANDSSVVDELPVKEGAVYGAGAFALTYALFYYLTQALMTFYGAEDGASTWVAAGWSFLATLNVGFTANGEEVAFSAVPAGIGSTELLILGLVPPLVLIATGYAFVRRVDPDDLAETAKTSLLLVPPFLALAVVSAFLMTHSYSTEAQVGVLIQSVEALGGENPPSSVDVGPALGDAVIWAGIVYPALFGLIGGAIARWDEVADAALAQIE